jgi:predicted DNA-binding transcriptional regulator AlpA
MSNSNRGYRLLSYEDVIQRTTLSMSLIKRFAKDGECNFPAPVKIAGRICFVESEINDWIHQAICQSRGIKPFSN